MRAALVGLGAMVLLLAARAAYAQVESSETPSLLPLPSFAPPPLTGQAPAGLTARTPPRRAVAGPPIAPWESDGPANVYPLGGYGRPMWEQPTEVLPGVSRSGIRTIPNMGVADCGPGGCGPGGCGPGGCGPGGCGPGGCGPGGGAGGPGCLVLGGSPFAEALNTSGLPPFNLYGMQVRPGYWFGSLAGLVMTRDAPNALSTTYNSTNVNTNLLDTGQARANWAGGGQVMFGRWFGPQRYGMQFVYWGLGPMTGSANVVDPNYQLSTPFNLGGVSIGQQSPTFYFDNAHEHAVWRKDGFNNFEWNALRRATFGCCASRLRQNDWTSFAAFGCGASLNTPFGPMISGEPSLA